MTAHFSNRATLILVILAAILPVRTMLGQEGDETAPAQPDPIRVRYAQINLELAESQLEERLEQNKKMPNFYSESELHRYRMNVQVAKRQLSAAEAGDNDLEVHLQRAKEQVELTQADYQRAMKANLAEPNVYSKYQLNELRLKAELAKLRFAIWSKPEANLLSLFDHLHWQIDQFSEEILTLQRRVETLEREGIRRR